MITIKTPEEIKIMAEGGKILAKIMKELAKKVKPGITPKELDRAAEALILNYGAAPSFKGYLGFPACLCVSINEEIVHGIPSERILQQGDVVKLDLGILYKGFHNDMAITVGVGKISVEAKKLIKATKKALDIAIKKCQPGVNINEIGLAIEKCAEENGFSEIRELCGHGIGKMVHEDPQILNYFEKSNSFILKIGMVICLEPMMAIGGYKIKKSRDNYGFSTQDGSLSAHFEHTVAITEKRPQVLTKG